MFNFILYEIKTWWLGEPIDFAEEFELMESKHTRVHYDEDFFEVIRVH